jgi:hypothetical protein
MPVRCRSWWSIGTTQIGKSPAMPPPIWKKPIEPSPLFSCLAVFVYHAGELGHVLDAGAHRVDVLDVARDDVAANMLPRVESSQPGTMIGRFFSQAASSQEFFGSIWYHFFSFPPRRILYMNSCGKYLSPAGRPRSTPRGRPSRSGAWPPSRDAGVGHPVHVPGEERLLVLRGQLPVVRDALIVVVGDQVEHVLLKVGARAHDGVDLVLADHLGQRDAELGRGHGARQRHEHLAAGLQVASYAFAASTSVAALKCR